MYRPLINPDIVMVRYVVLGFAMSCIIHTIGLCSWELGVCEFAKNWSIKFYTHCGLQECVSERIGFILNVIGPNQYIPFALLYSISDWLIT